MNFKNVNAFLLLAFQSSFAFQSIDVAPKNLRLTRLEDPNSSSASGHFEEAKLASSKEEDNEYWNNPKIHVFGNNGITGAFHAAVAPLSTKLIDLLAYGGQDVRKIVADKLSRRIQEANVRVLDMCCGVGISTRALRRAFPESDTVMGLDASCQMLSMAKFISSQFSAFKAFCSDPEQRTFFMANCANTAYRNGNAEDTAMESQSFDLVTIMYGFHEVPSQGRARILREAHRLLAPGGTLAVVDIASDFVPPPSMLAGEPYVQEYQQNIHKQLENFEGLIKESYETLVPRQVGMWVLKRS